MLKEYADDARVEKPDGTVFGPYKASFPGKTIFILDKNADVEEGDVVLRTLPNGKDERSFVSEVTFYKKGIGGIGAHYNIKYTKGRQTEKRKPDAIHRNDGAAAGYPGAYDSAYEPSAKEENVLGERDELRKYVILQETYEFERQQRTDPQLKSKAITQGGLSKGLKFLLGEVIGLCKELEEDDLIRLSRKTSGGERAAGKRVVTITAAGRSYLNGLSNDDATSVRVFRNSIKQTSAAETGDTGTSNESGSPGGGSSSSSNANGTGTKNPVSITKTIQQRNVDVVSNSVLISCQTLQQSIEEFSENIRTSNALAALNPEAHSEITTFLVELKDQIDHLINILPDDNNNSKKNRAVENISDWYTNTGIESYKKMQSLFTPEYVGENVTPLIIVGIFSSVCAAVSSALGVAPTTGALVGGLSAANYVNKGQSLVKEVL